uniref:ABC transporter domain-containing protein n=1 Tax=Glossina palpalis gambiensis TaxID=67801 RepID=A0A1B0B920_9MUSC
MIENIENISSNDHKTDLLNDAIISIPNTTMANVPKFNLQDLHLNYHFVNVSYSGKQNRSKTVEILKDVYGQFNSGQLTAILGPSGAGKTSLMNVLSGFKTIGVTGTVQINGQERQLNEFRKMSAYIPQKFAMLDLLTVQETLKVSVDLKLPKIKKTLEKAKIIDAILELLNLENSRKTLVRNLSGGERKRLSIGVELVTNPPIMFFDEPTSGLDSVASLQIITHLRRLAQGGRMIICVVHQPSSKLMRLFDNVLVMAGGEVLYSGLQNEMIERFEKFGFQCPQYYNPADFVLEVASERAHNCKNIVKLIEQNKSIHSLSRSEGAIDQVNETTDLLTKINLDNSAVASQFSESNLWHQFAILVNRSVLSMSRNMMAVQLRVISHVIVALLLGIVFWQIGDDGSKVLSNVSCIFFVVLFVFFGNAMPSIFLSSEDTEVFIREHLNGWYSKKAYYMAKIIADLPVQFICPTILLTIVYFMTGQPCDIGRFVMCWGISLLSAIIGHFMGLVFGSAFGLQIGIYLVPAVTIPIMIFSGFFIRIHEVADVLRPLCDLSFFRYTMEAFLRALYAYERPFLKCTDKFCYYKNPSKFLNDYGMSGNLYGIDFCALLLWIAVLNVLFFISLLWRVKKAQ